MRNNEIEEFEEDEINLLDYLIVILKRKKMIVGVTLSAVVITAVISLVMTPIYRAETKILPPQQGGSSMASQMLSQFGGGMAGLVGGSLGIKTTADLYVEMLKSRTVLDKIVDRFNLMELYDAEIREDAREELMDSLMAKADKKSGLITIGVEDRDPQRSADMSNAFVEELRELNKRLAVTEASQRRLFFEEQLKDAKESLIEAEESMQVFQEETGAFRVDEQAMAVLEGITRLRAQVAAKEVELRVMRTYATAQNPDIQRTEEGLKGLREQLRKLEVKDTGYNPDSFVPTSRMPSVGTEYIRKLREFKYNEALYEILLRQYEAARLDEARDAAIIQVIDRAVPPEKKVKPKRALMVIIATFTTFFFSLFAAFFMEYMEKSSETPEDKKRLEMLRRYAKFRNKDG